MKVNTRSKSAECMIKPAQLTDYLTRFQKQFERTVKSCYIFNVNRCIIASSSNGQAAYIDAHKDIFCNFNDIYERDLSEEEVPDAFEQVRGSFIICSN